MIKKYSLLFLLLLLLSFQSCDDNKKTQQLLDRENSLLEKEKLFAEKESEYQSLLKMRDSIFNIKDTVEVVKKWPAEVFGSWSGKVICTESSCNDYVIGDQRMDTWEFDSDSTQLVSKIVNNNKLVRIYSGSYENNEVKLNYKTDSAANKSVEMNVILNEISATKMRGIRTITVDNKCTAKFSVELTRSSK
ncbi:hypothetical protein CHRY9390_02366 [Chryseobacterium aquaeductus]|uniref:Lipocalin-like protein n=1 Tax=Chryseobacterium aquaeductus TaxID=2675056 RepID=A0A9N8MI85_9FLAO|nr:hypothetical protein [Chryseobacterium aquaeductus]CAA7331653.1 hypothetical protein CHRY9390_02366 [Chryseobacterium potabilaquae]CAD7811497.1 hypothetical protein CHRY9390_02366 [Chryseobacterium aquaeductus]